MPGICKNCGKILSDSILGKLCPNCGVATQFGAPAPLDSSHFEPPPLTSIASRESSAEKGKAKPSLPQRDSFTFEMEAGFPKGFVPIYLIIFILGMLYLLSIFFDTQDRTWVTMTVFWDVLLIGGMAILHMVNKAKSVSISIDFSQNRFFTKNYFAGTGNSAVFRPMKEISWVEIQRNKKGFGFKFKILQQIFQCKPIGIERGEIDWLFIYSLVQQIRNASQCQVFLDQNDYLLLTKWKGLNADWHLIDAERKLHDIPPRDIAG